MDLFLNNLRQNRLKSVNFIDENFFFVISITKLLEGDIFND
jgi:hypothetical protein